MTKRNIVFHNNKTVSFEEHRFFTFDNVSSVMSEDTNITMVNVPLIVSNLASEKRQRMRTLGFRAVPIFGV